MSLESIETDPRLPSGEWSGFYLEDHQPRRGWMHLYLDFQEGEIRGEGTDYVGPWILHGSYELPAATCQWTKQYVGKHQVNYRGRITDNGIQGGWTIQDWSEGFFHVWPRSRTDLQNLYLQDEVDANDPSVLLDGRQVPPDNRA